MEELRNLGSFTNSTVTLFNQLSGYQVSPNVSKKTLGLHTTTARLAKLGLWHLPADMIGHRMCAANSTLSQRKKEHLALSENLPTGPFATPDRCQEEKQTTQCHLSDRRSTASMVYSIIGLHLTENIILRDQKPTDVPVRHVCLPAKVQVERLIGLVKHHHPTELT